MAMAVAWMEGTRFNADCRVHLAAGGIQKTCHVFFLSILSVIYHLDLISKTIPYLWMKASLCGADTFSTSRSLAVHITTMILPALFSRFSRKALNNADDCIGWLATFSTWVMSLTLLPHLSKVILTFRKNSKWLSLEQPTLKVLRISRWKVSCNPPLCERAYHWPFTADIMSNSVHVHPK